MNNDLLYQRLKEMRNKLAVDAHVEPYMVFQNKVLQAIAEKQPATLEELTAIIGIDFKEGLELHVDGNSEVYKRRGSFTFKIDHIGLIGEGALPFCHCGMWRQFPACRQAGFFPLDFTPYSLRGFFLPPWDYLVYHCN